MFKLDLSPTYKWPVTVRLIEESGRLVERKFHAHFRRLKKSEIEDITKRVDAGGISDADFLREILDDWEGIVDAEGNPVECTDETIGMLGDIPEVSAAIGQAWLESLTGGPRKN